MGDGNFHCLIVLDPNDPDEVQRVHSFTERLARYFYLISFSSFALLQLSSEAAERDWLQLLCTLSVLFCVAINTRIIS